MALNLSSIFNITIKNHCHFSFYYSRPPLCDCSKREIRNSDQKLDLRKATLSGKCCKQFWGTSCEAIHFWLLFFFDVIDFELPDTITEKLALEAFPEYNSLADVRKLFKDFKCQIPQSKGKGKGKGKDDSREIHF